MDILGLIKELFESPDHAFLKLTPEYFASTRASMNTDEYVRWLQKTVASYVAIIYRRSIKGYKIPPEWIPKMNLLDDEVNKFRGPSTANGFPMSDKRLVDLVTELQTKR